MIIGSRALEALVPGYKAKEDSDLDVISCEGNKDLFEDVYPANVRVEIHDFYDLNNLEAFLRYQGTFKTINSKSVQFCTLKGLALIKRSHLHRNYFFDKHIYDYHKWILPNLGNIVFTLEDQEFLQERIKLTKKAYPKRMPNLNQTNEDFFDDAVDKEFDHDYLHDLYAYTGVPLYKRLKFKGNEGLARCEKSLWDRLEPWEKDMCVAEETYVIATERFVLPGHWKGGFKRAYMSALRKVCTDLAQGWFSDHAIDHYPDIVGLYSEDKFNEVLYKLGKL